MSGRASLRLGVLSTHLIQYFSPLYRHLARRVEALEVGYFRHIPPHGPGAMYDPGFGASFAWDVDLTSGYDHVSFGLPNAPFEYRAIDVARLVAETRAWLSRFRPDVVLVPGWTPAYVLAARVVGASGVPFVIRPEGRVPRGGRPLRRFARDLWVGDLVRRASAAAVVGTASRDELLRLGMPPARLVASPYVIDTDSWVPALAAARPRRDELRDRLGLRDQDVAYLFVGKLVEYKRPRLLVDAFASVCSRVPTARLLLVGDGPLRGDLQRRAAQAGVASRITFASFVNQGELPDFYAAADVFALTSSETWGLVVNEAMLAGLPLAVSVDAGCVRDLVTDGVTGRRLHVEDPRQVADALEELADPQVRRAMTPNLARLAAGYTLEKAAEGIVRAAVIARDAGP